MRRLDSPREPLAVVGIGCRFPGRLNSAASFWRGLLDGVDAITEVPADRWLSDALYDPDPAKAGHMRSRRGGFLADIDQFDAEFFDIFPAAASQLDPQQRMLLEVAYETFEDAGATLAELAGSRTGVFIGTFVYDYHCMQLESGVRDRIVGYSAMGAGMASIANRLSYSFDLRGPSLMLDTYCSSSLVALHLACRAIWGGEADAAIAGGVNAILRPEFGIALSKAGFLSPDGACKAFDASANGYVRSEGTGLVYLKPLSAAIAHRDRIHALVLGSAVNQDGFVADGFTVPNLSAQVAMLQAAYRDAGVEPMDVAYVEAHGPGTVVGDPIEARALGSVLGQGRDPLAPLLVGSVKTNLGHLEGAAGVAGFIKGTLVAKHGRVPPNLHFKQPNPAIDFGRERIRIATGVIDLPRGDAPAVIGVNSFGAGGTNAHVVLSAHRISDAVPSRAPTRASLFTVSAKSPAARAALAGAHAGYIESSDAPLSDIAYSQHRRRSRLSHQLYVHARSRTELVEKLRRFQRGESVEGISTHHATGGMPPKLAFVYSGQGGQWAGMGAALMEDEPVFRAKVEEIDRLFGPLAGWSLIDEIRKPKAESRIDDTTVVQPAVMAIQIALTVLYRHYGVQPAGIVGHSIGEVAAAWAAGAIDLPTAVAIIYHRSRIQDRATDKGRMLAVGIDHQRARRLLLGLEDQVSVSAINAPEMLTLAGDAAALANISADLDGQGVFNRFVNVRVPYHSHLMEPLRADLLAALAPFAGQATHTPLYSTVTGKPAPGTHLDGRYWYENVRQPVMFAAAFTQMLEDGYTTFIEIGPHAVLGGPARAMIGACGSKAVAAPAMARGESTPASFWLAMGAWLAAGGAVDDRKLFGDEPRYVELPSYRWQHRRHWSETAESKQLRTGAETHPFLRSSSRLVSEPDREVWKARVDIASHPFLKDHEVDGAFVLPATAHLELAHAIARRSLGMGEISLRDLRFHSALVQPDADREPSEVRFEMTSSDGSYAICSRRPDESDTLAWTRHSTGRIDLFGDARATEDVSLESARNAFGDEDELDVEAFYAHRRAAGLVYGKRFQCVDKLWQRGPRILAKLQLGPEIEHESDRLLVHPALLDAAIHATFAAVHATEEPERPYLPHHIVRVSFFGTLPREAWSLIRVNRLDANILAGDAWIFDAEGRLIVEFEGLTCRHVPDGAGAGDELTRGLYEQGWKAAADRGAHAFAQEVKTCVITGHPNPLASAVAARLRAQEPAIEIVERPVPPPGTSVCTSWLAGLDDAFVDGRTHLLYFAPTRALLTEAMDGAEVKASLVSLAMPLLELMQAVVAAGGVLKIYLITSGAEALPGERVVHPAHSMLQGLGRVLNNECPTVPIKLIDTSADSITAAEVNGICQEVLVDRLDADESEVALRDDRRYVSELRPLSADDPEESQGRDHGGRVRRVSAIDAGYRAEIDSPARVTFRDVGELELGERDIEIAVAAAAVTSRDVQRVVAGAGTELGEPGAGLGRSIAGRVTRVGRRVEGVNVGDEVIASVGDGLAGRAVTSADCVAPKPVHLSFAQAAALPASYLGALYAVHRLAKLTAAETLLVVGDGDGVGLAALHVALRVGARIIAASDPGGAPLLRPLGSAVIECSQSKMHEQVLAATDGKGVDVVLNFGTGRLATQGLRCLKPFGRFVELRRPDSYLGHTLSIRCMQNNLSYFAVDLEDLARQRADLQAELMAELGAFFRDGARPPEAVEEFPISDLKGALKRAGQMGRFAKPVVVTAGDTVEVWPARRWRLRSDRTYLVTGGASGLGLRIAQRMAERGARRLLLASRSGPRMPEDDRILQELRSQGARVDLVAVDVADSVAVQRVIDDVAASGMPLAGIVHAAAVMDDVALAKMTPDRFAGPLGPKAVGAWNLHVATRAQALEFFVCVSSISSVLGLAGTLNYASANRFVEGLMAYRRGRGLAGSTLALGVLGDYAGLSRATPNNRHMLDVLEGQGFRRMRLEDVLAKLELAVVEGAANRVAALVDWNRFANAHPHLTRDTRLGPAIASARDRKGRAAGGRLTDRLRQLPRAEALEELLARVIENLGRLLGLPHDRIGRDDTIDRFGLDSIMLAQLSSWFLRELDLGIPFMRLLRGPSLLELSEELLERLHGSVAAQSGDGDEVVSLSESDGVRAVGKWLIRGNASGHPPVRLFCFHSMGIGASLFTPFLLNAPPNIEPFAVQTPGREDRSEEPLLTNLSVLVKEIQAALAPHLDRPAIFWGHSFGGIVAYEVLRSLQRKGLRIPDHLVLTATAAPHLVGVWQKRDGIQRVTVEENSNQYLMSISRYLDDPAFVGRLLPLMRRDLPLLRTHHFVQEQPLSIPITAYCAIQDDMIYKDEIEAWRGYTTRTFDLKLVDGDHWFLRRHQDAIRNELARIATRIFAPTASGEDEEPAAVVPARARL